HPCGEPGLSAVAQRRDPSRRGRWSSAPDLPGREHPPTAFIKLRADGLPTFANRLAINHADPHIATSQRKESRRPESHRHMPSDPEPIHLYWRVSLVAAIAGAVI